MSPARRRGKTGEREQVDGLVSSLPVAAASKSEHDALGIETSAGEFLVVHVAGDTPFAEETLRAVIGQRVRLDGTWRNGTLRVDRAGLVVVEPPAATETEGGAEGEPGAAKAPEGSTDPAATGETAPSAAPSPEADEGPR